MLFPAVATPPALLPFVPARASEWTAGKFQADRAAALVVAVWRLFEDVELPAEANPFRFVQPDYLQWGRLREGGSTLDPLGEFTILVRVREPEAYAAALAKFWKLVRQLPAEVAVDERFPAGTEVQRVSVLGFVPLVHARHGDRVVIAHGEDAVERAAQLLAQQPGEPPAGVTARQGQQPPGWNGCGRWDARAALARPPTGLLVARPAAFEFVMFDEAGGIAKEPTPWEQAVGPILPLLEKHALQQAWTFEGWHEQRYRHRVVW